AADLMKFNTDLSLNHENSALKSTCKLHQHKTCSVNVLCRSCLQPFPLQNSCYMIECFMEGKSANCV
ncbi:Uncharacterized protein DAT39_009215, partial [Clarias magur]